MSAGIYSPFKAAFFQDRVLAAAGKVHAQPVHVQVILSDLCNQNCHFCAYRMEGFTSNQLFGRPDDHGRINPNRRIPTEKALEILDDCSEMGVQAIQFTGGGEPTVHPDHLMIFRRAEALGLKWALVTNGTKLSPQLQDALVRSASWVRISLDAGTPETYARVRETPPATFRRVLDSVASLTANKREKGSALEVGIGFVVTPDNWREVMEAVGEAKAAGADNIRLSAMFSQHDEEPYAAFHAEAAALCKATEEMGDETFSVVNRFSERLSDLRLKAPDYKVCGYQRFTTYIGGDLNVYRCCNTAYNERGLLGSIAHMRFLDLWNSQEAASLLRDFDARGCARCQFHGINRFVNELTEIPTSHAAFV